MPVSLQQQFRGEAPDLPRTHPDYVLRLVDSMLTSARKAGASDIHLLPGEDGLAMSWRIDGVLHPIELLPRAICAEYHGAPQGDVAAVDVSDRRATRGTHSSVGR